MMSKEPLYQPDFIGETWEYVETSLETVQKKNKISPKGFFGKFRKNTDVLAPESECVYVKGYRIPIGIQSYCFEPAFQTISSGVTSKHMEEYGAAIELRTRNEMKNQGDEWMVKLLKILIPCGIFAVLAAIAFTIIQSGAIPGT